MGYHFIVHLDGRVEAGRALDKIGAHVEGHNVGTIGVAYVGGVAKDGKTPKDTRTEAQKAALAKLITELHARFNFKKLSGHNEYAAKACPSFDAKAAYGHLVTGDAAYQPAADGLLKRGDDGPEVAVWRSKLRQAGYDVPLGDDFDQLTEQVTRWFQAKRGVVIDGKVGAQTRDEMERFLAGKGPFEAMPQPQPAPTLFERKAPGIMAIFMQDFPVLGIEDAAAVLGNIGHECAGFTSLQQKNGSGYGWPQWDGVRKTAYLNWCRAKGLDPAGDKANYGYMVEELRTTEKRAIPALTAAVGLDAKVIAFEKAFERAGIKHYASRQDYARRALAAFRATPAPAQKGPEVAIGTGTAIVVGGGTIGVVADENPKAGLYVGIGFLIVAIVIGAVVIIRRRKKKPVEKTG